MCFCRSTMPPTKSTFLKKTQVYFVDSISRCTNFWDTFVPGGSQNSHKVVELNSEEIKFSPESTRAIVRNLKIHLQKY